MGTDRDCIFSFTSGHILERRISSQDVELSRDSGSLQFGIFVNKQWDIFSLKFAKGLIIIILVKSGVVSFIVNEIDSRV